MTFSAHTFRPAIVPLAYLAKRGVSVASALRGWAADRQREVRIRDLRLRMSVAFAARDEISVRHLGRLMFAECDARSPRQVAKMERRLLDSLDPHARQVLGK